MPTNKRARVSRTVEKDKPTIVEIRNEKDAHTLFAAFLDDEREVKSAATTFIKLGSQLAGNTSDRSERHQLYQELYDRIVRNSATRQERTSDEKASELRRILDDMREKNLTLRSSPTANRAHMEIDIHQPSANDLYAAFTVPEGRTRAEHAGLLNQTNQEARDLFERGATVYDNTLIIPRLSEGSPDRNEQIRIGSLAHAAREFTPLIGEDEAKIRAAEFVELGSQIAGVTADGDTRLITFRTFYQEIKRDEQGRFRTPEEQAAQIEIVLERMRLFASAMREQEWQREPYELLSFEDWERGLEARQRDAENERYGRLTYRLEEILDSELEEERTARERDEILSRAEERAVVVGTFANVEYERIRLDDLPPRLPEGLTEEEEARLRYEIIPRLDRQLEIGASYSDIMRGLAIQAEKEERQGREAEITHVLLERAPKANLEHAVTREEEARALYSLRALGASVEASLLSQAKVKRDKFLSQTQLEDIQTFNHVLDQEIEQRKFTDYERAAAINTVGKRLAQDYREQINRLNSLASLETERELLQDEANKFRETIRATPEFQQLLTAAHAQEREDKISERETLIRSNNAMLLSRESTQISRLLATFRQLESIPATNYPELLGEPRQQSKYASLHQENEQSRGNLRRQLESLLISPDLERKLELNSARVEESLNYFRRFTGHDIDNSTEAREALQPKLSLMRATLDYLAVKRSAISIERTRPVGERQTNPLYISLSTNSSNRLAVENINEYRTLMSIAEKYEVSVHSYAGLYGPEINGSSRAREESLNFARDYIAYRLNDTTTRMLNSNRLFREYYARLSGARSPTELHEAIKEIRQENYARAKFPERFRDEISMTQKRGEQVRRPLTEREMQNLMLAPPAPTHYTEEMRALLLEYSGSARDKAERIKGLEKGTLAPSPALKLLLTEFDRTHSNNPVQYARNIKSFLADYLNPPANNQYRFSAHNLYELRGKLSPAERDYFFKVVDGTKQAVISGEKVKLLELGQTPVIGFDVRSDARENSSTSHANRNGFVNLREQLEERVASYLISVVQTRGVQALESNRESLHHATAISRIIEQTFAEKGYRLEDFRLNQERIATVSGKLVGELPHALRASRSRALSPELSLDRSTQQLHEQEDRNQLSRNEPIIVADLDRSLDDQVVEQKVSRTLGLLTDQGSNRELPHVEKESHHAGRQSRAQDIGISAREQSVRQHVLVK